CLPRDSRRWKNQVAGRGLHANRAADNAQQDPGLPPRRRDMSAGTSFDRRRHCWLRACGLKRTAMRTLPECATAENENEPSDCHLIVYKTNATTQPAGRSLRCNFRPGIEIMRREA